METVGKVSEIDPTTLILDNVVDYTDSVIDAQTAIEGMTDIDNDDGQFHATTDDINRIASNSGRRALLNYERDPKEVSQEHLLDRALMTEEAMLQNKNS